jgi:large subunit ribosomal protein L25
MELTVECQKRPEGSKPNSLRRDGLIPAVLYGHNGTESVALTLNTRVATTLVRKAVLNNTMIELSVPEISWSGKALLREVQAHPWKRSLYHLSFFSVGSQSSIEVTVPLHFVGESTGVKQDGGTLDIVLNEVAVACAPSDVPDTIEIDISNMKVGDALHVNELALPAGITVLGEADRVVVSVLGTASAETEAEAEVEASA